MFLFISFCRRNATTSAGVCQHFCSKGGNFSVKFRACCSCGLNCRRPAALASFNLGKQFSAQRDEHKFSVAFRLAHDKGCSQVRTACGWEAGQPLGWFVNYLRPGSIGLGPSLNPNTNLRVDRFYERAASLLIRYQNLQIEATLKFHGGVSRVSCQMRPAETQSVVSSVSRAVSTRV